MKLSFAEGSYQLTRASGMFGCNLVIANFDLFLIVYYVSVRSVTTVTT